MSDDTVPRSDLGRREALNLIYKPNEYSQQRQREKKRWIWPVHLAMEATYHNALGDTVVWDDQNLITPTSFFSRVITEPEGISFSKLPPADRILTAAFNPKYQENGNYKYSPGTYIQSAGGCWWGKCVFCKENGCKYELRSVDHVIEEIKECKKLGFREIFDDAASFPIGKWRDEFIKKLKPLDIKFSCNMRFGTFPDYYAMKKAGFRMMLYGLESANEKTLIKINKRINIKHAIEELKLASKYGLEPHVAVMFGYPWETDSDAERTLDLVHFLLKKGYAKTAQASLYNIPGGKNKKSHSRYVSRIYEAAYSLEFWINRLKCIRNKDDIKYIWKGIKAWRSK